MGLAQNTTISSVSKNSFNSKVKGGAPSSTTSAGQKVVQKATVDNLAIQQKELRSNLVPLKNQAQQQLQNQLQSPSQDSSSNQQQINRHSNLIKSNKNTQNSAGNEKRRNLDQQISRTSERILTKMRPEETPTTNTSKSIRPKMAADHEDTVDSDYQSETTRVAEDSIMDFLQPTKNLSGRIGIYKINFNKNLRRFQEIASE